MISSGINARTRGIFFCSLILCLFPVSHIYAQQNAGARIPPAFPEETPAVPDTIAPPPIAVPPGKPQHIQSVPAVTDPAPISAAWILERMAASGNAETRRRASEAWPVTESFMKEMNALVFALVDPDATVRNNAVDRLHRLEAGQVFGYVMRTMVGGTVDRVKALDNALPSLEAKLTPLMLETLRTELETPQHRRIAAYCLGRMKSLAAVETLGHYATQSDQIIAPACVDALYAIGTPETLPYWMELLEHSDLYCRRRAACALAYLGGPNAVERVSAILLDPNGDLPLQTEALQAMGERPPLLLFPLLVKVLEQNNQLRPTALRMLRAQAGVDFGADIAAWQNWLKQMTAPPPPPIVPSQ